MADSEQRQLRVLIEKEANLLSYGYCRDHIKSHGNKYIPNDVQYIIFLYFGINNTPKTTIDRDGYFIKQMYTYSGRDCLQEIKKENDKLQKWMEVLFPTNNDHQTDYNVDNLSLNGDEKITKNWHNIQNNKNLKSLIRSGIPSSLRCIIWKNLCGAMKRKQIECKKSGSLTLYHDLVNNNGDSIYHDQMWKDINRTYRKHIQFGATRYCFDNDQDIEAKELVKYYKYSLQNTSQILTPQHLEQAATPSQQSLYNILKAFALFRADIGFSSGMSAFAAFLLMNMSEEDAFWTFVAINEDDDKYKITGVRLRNMPEIQLRFYQMERCVKSILPKLNKHFERNGISSASMYQASQWFITIFLATDMRFDTIYRIWDIWLNEGYKAVFRFGIGFLKYFQKDLLKSDFEKMLDIFRTAAPLIDTDKYIKISLALKLTHKQLDQYKRDFAGLNGN